MAIIEKIKKFVKDITPPSDDKKVKIEEKQMKVEEMKDPDSYRKNKAMYDTSTEVKKFDDNYKKGFDIITLNQDGMAMKISSSRHKEIFEKLISLGPLLDIMKARVLLEKIAD